MFGSFPLTYIASTLGYGVYQLAVSNGSSEFSLLDESSSDDLKYLLISSAVMSVGVATADLIIGKIKNRRAREQGRSTMEKSDEE